MKRLNKASRASEGIECNFCSVDEKLFFERNIKKINTIMATGI